MSVEAHIDVLVKKHQDLSDQIEDLQRSLSSDDLELVQLKKQKLQLKEEIAKLQGG